PGVGVVYGLFDQYFPLQLRYVGQTSISPVIRLYQHFSQNRKYRVFRWVKEVESSGSEVSMRILGRYPLSDLNAAEKKWILFWGNYCDLLNLNHQPEKKKQRKKRQNRLKVSWGWVSLDDDLDLSVMPEFK